MPKAALQPDGASHFVCSDLGKGEGMRQARGTVRAGELARAYEQPL